MTGNISSSKTDQLSRLREVLLKLISPPFYSNSLDIVDENANDLTANRLARGVPSINTAVSQPEARAAGKATPKKTSSSGKAPSKGCKAKKRSSRFMPRALYESKAKPVANTLELYEDDYKLVNDPDVKKGVDLAVVNVSGCSALFFFRADGHPSVFHIFSGNEAADTPKAVALAKSAGNIKSVTVWAPNPTKGELIQAAIEKAIPSFEGHVTPEIYGSVPTGKRFRFDVTVPEVKVTKSLYECISMEP